MLSNKQFRGFMRHHRMATKLIQITRSNFFDISQDLQPPLVATPFSRNPSEVIQSHNFKCLEQARLFDSKVNMIQTLYGQNNDQINNILKMFSPHEYQIYKNISLMFFRRLNQSSFFSFTCENLRYSLFLTVSSKDIKNCSLKQNLLLNVKCCSDNIIFKQASKAMFPYYNQPSMTFENSSPNYYIIHPTYFYSLNSIIEQMKVREQNLRKQVTELKEECQDLKLSLNQNFQQLVKECLSQHLNSKPESQNYTFYLKSYKCKMEGCPKRYSSKIALKAHLKTKHDSSDQYD